MKNNNYIMQRIFMPIGQGAFYIEKFNDDFTVVYDCGSYGNLSTIEDNIKKSILDTKIDLLVISHYHEDHINGLEYLFKNYDIKKMLMPYLNITEKIVSFLDEDIKNNSNNFYKEFCINPSEALLTHFNKAIEITFVHPEQSEQSTEVDIQKLQQKINSGDKVIYKINNCTWSYIPFNFQNAKKASQFKKYMSHLPINNINDFEKYYISNKDEFIKIYEEIPGDKNTNSLVLYSGIYSNKRTTTYSTRKKFNFTQNVSGCLYLGDYNSKGNSKMKELKEKYNEYFSSISTIQIPHHGSNHNYNKDLNFKPNILSVISAGINNQFKHPHENTIKEITIQKGIVILVTEESETKFIQNIYINK